MEVIQPETARCVFTCDHQGRRRTKKTYSWDEQAEDWALDVERVFIYDVWNLAHELITDHTRSPAEESTKSYVWGLDLSQTLQGAGGVGGLLSATSPATTSFYAYDGNGNITSLVDADTPATVASYDYTPFGGIVSMSRTAAETNTFRFSTKYHDPETGLVYYGYRYYEPTLGRWMSRDPVAEMEGGAKLSAFIGNAPSDDVDAFGLRTYVDCMRDYRTCMSQALSDFGSCCVAAGISVSEPFLSCAATCAPVCGTIPWIPCAACWIGCTALTGPIALYRFSLCVQAYNFYARSCDLILDNCNEDECY